MYPRIPYYTIKCPTKIIQHHLQKYLCCCIFYSTEALDWCGVFALALVRVGRHLEVKAISKVRFWWFHRGWWGMWRWGVSLNGGFSPQIIYFNRVFHYFHHPFWVPLFLETPRCTSLMEDYFVFSMLGCESLGGATAKEPGVNLFPNLIGELLMGFAKPAMPQGTSHDIYSVSAQIFFQKNALFGQFLASEASQNKEGWVPPTPLPHLKF